MRPVPAMVSVIVGLAVLPASAHAATCSDFPNQAAAQRAANTRDADGDGVYCETLPCPCANGSAGGHGSRRKAKPRKRAQHIAGRISSVVDGDTIKVRAFSAKRRFYTVRLIGIDTPETHRPGRPVECGARRASGNMFRLAFTAPRDANGDGIYDQEGGTGRRVTLTTDPTQDTFDRYGRLLAYVTTTGGVYLQGQQLASGWANTYVYGHTPFEEVGRDRAAQARARAHRRGVYARCGGNFHKAL